ncbi:MAG: ATP-dependent RNA helicase RhlE [Candidatus Endobugula sp.]|jgi:ATP-dependent RNA helicase RhlE
MVYPMKFSSLDLSPEIQQALDSCGYTTMTPIQEQAIVPIRRGKDVLACAQTGTGKTATFALPILQQMMDKPPTAKDAISPRTLILTPTRELAEQLAETIGTYAQNLPFKTIAAYGGVKISKQVAKLNAGADIVIATPGRLLELLSQCHTHLANVKYVVLDEADRMLDMGFLNDVQTILNATSKQRQTLLFSATLSPAVTTFAHKVLKSHQEIRVSKANSTADTVEHIIYSVEEKRKIELFNDLLDEHNWYQALVFTSTKEQADSLLLSLKKRKVAAAICHGDKTQGARRRALADFKSAKIQILIATEVAARGLDIEGLEYVINYNLPFLAEDYVHRIGRTGRAGNKGYAISLVSREEERSLDAIQRLIGQKIKRVKRSGYEVFNRRNLVEKIETGQRVNRKNKSSQTVIKKGAS